MGTFFALCDLVRADPAYVLFGRGLAGDDEISGRLAALDPRVREFVENAIGVQKKSGPAPHLQGTSRRVDPREKAA